MFIFPSVTILHLCCAHIEWILGVNVVRQDRDEKNNRPNVGKAYGTAYTTEACQYRGRHALVPITGNWFFFSILIDFWSHPIEEVCATSKEAHATAWEDESQAVQYPQTRVAVVKVRNSESREENVEEQCRGCRFLVAPFVLRTSILI